MYDSFHWKWPPPRTRKKEWKGHIYVYYMLGNLLRDGLCLCVWLCVCRCTSHDAGTRPLTLDDWQRVATTLMNAGTRPLTLDDWEYLTRGGVYLDSCGCLPRALFYRCFQCFSWVLGMLFYYQECFECFIVKCCVYRPMNKYVNMINTQINTQINIQLWCICLVLPGSLI